MSAALPDRYGVSDSKDELKVVTNNLLVSMGMITGACGLAVMASSLGVRTGEFFNFANYFLDTLGQTPFVIFVAGASLGLGFLGVLVGAIVSFSGLFVSKYPKCVYFALVCLFAIAAGNIAVGAIVQQGITLLDDAIYKPQVALARNAVVNITFTQRVVHFQLAMFNGCCANQGSAYSKETWAGIDSVFQSADMSGYVKWCNGPSVDGAALSDQIRPSNYQDLVTGLKRSCYRDQETYRQYNFTVTHNLARICQTFTDARVNIAGKKVPGIPSLDVTALTEGNAIVPIVAPNASPNFGCGGGYAKAFQAAMLIWAENILTPVSMSFLICGSIEMLLVIIGLISTYFSGRTHESAEEKYARYLEEIQNNSSSQGVVKQAQVVDTFEQANPNRMSVQNPTFQLQHPGNRMSVQSSATNGSQSNGQQAKQEFAFNVDDKI